LVGSVREVFLIVVGILIAFFLDAWWDDPQEQNRLHEALAAVRKDFLATQVELTTVLEANERYVREVSRLIRLEADDVTSLDDADAVLLAQLLPTGGLTFDPVLGSVEALISGGQLHRIENVELGSAIAAWPARLDEIGEDQEILIDTYMAQQERSVTLGIYVLQFLGETREPGEAHSRDQLRLAVADVEMKNRLAAHRFAVVELGRELGAVQAQLDQILALLDQALERE